MARSRQWQAWIAVMAAGALAGCSGTVTVGDNEGDDGAPATISPQEGADAVVGAGEQPDASCGNGVCTPNEDCAGCPQDCGSCPPCGDGMCDATESCASCAQDCGACPGCGNGTCGPNEDCASCAQDCGACPCAHASCETGDALDASCDPCVAQICAVDSFCCDTYWDGLCVAEVGSVCGTPCPVACGDGVCGQSESCSTCAQDCGACAACGDGYCDWSESCSACPQDCGACAACGDGACDPGESCGTCAQDCGTCPGCPAIDLGSGVPQTVTGSTVGLVNALPSPCAYSNAPEQTYSFTAPADGMYELNTFGSGYDTILYVLDGTCQGPSLACDDDTPPGFQSEVAVDLVSGQTVVIGVDGFGSQQGAFTLRICDGACPASCGDGACDPSESCGSCAQDCGACVVCGDGQCAQSETCGSCPGDCGACPVCGDGQCAQSETCGSCPGDCGACACHPVCQTGGPLDASCGTCEAQICAVDPFCCTGAWDQICVNEVGSVCGTPCGTACGDGVCSALESCSACPQDCGACAACGDGVCDPAEGCAACPADCGACPACSTTDLGSLVPQSVTGSTAGLPDTAPSPCGAPGGPDTAFTFTAPADGAYVINTEGSAYDTILHVHDATCGGAVLACDDDGGVGLQSQVSVTLTAGQTIAIVVDGFSSSQGAFTLNIQ